MGLNFGNDMEASGQHVLAALSFSVAAETFAEVGDKEFSHWLIRKVVLSLENARADNHGPNETLDALVASLKAVDATPPPDARVSALVQEALSLVERFRTLRDAGGT
jgi:hypothetical protein